MRPASERCVANAAAAWANEPIRPPQPEQVRGTIRLVPKGVGGTGRGIARWALTRASRGTKNSIERNLNERVIRADWSGMTLSKIMLRGFSDLVAAGF
jgi:hypothetical protein